MVFYAYTISLYILWSLLPSILMFGKFHHITYPLRMYVCAMEKSTLIAISITFISYSCKPFAGWLEDVWAAALKRAQGRSPERC